MSENSYIPVHVQLAQAVLAYSHALDEAQTCERGVSGFRTLQGENLDALFDRMLQLSGETLEAFGLLKNGDPFPYVVQRTDLDLKSEQERN